MTTIDFIGFFGVSMILLAYFLQLNEKLSVDSISYILLNLIGASLACFASWWIRYYPFVLLEGTWVFVSVFALFKKRS
ncbi:MAG: CBU_0592 family membrane protein [Aureispira sp.]